MTDNIVIKVENLSKIYKLYDTPIDRMKEALSWSGKKHHKDFYALNDINFAIKKGEIVGVIGKNGSGKSTLLKIITGVLSATSGAVTVNGKVSALLELGAGFNPEYTGIENIYFQGNIMGYSKAEIDAKLQEILDFAEIGDFVYQPVKSYSSGMFARLAFAVAINIEPDILIVDEALSVGDAFFQTKCMDRMTRLMQAGVTVLFVSHDISAVRSFCHSAIFLENGHLLAIGGVAEVSGLYMQQVFLENNANLDLEYNALDVSNLANEKFEPDTINDDILISVVEEEIKCIRRYGSGSAQILNAKIFSNGQQTDELTSCSEYVLQLAIKFNEDLDNWVVVAPICTMNGTQQLGFSSSVYGYKFPSVKSGDIYCIKIKAKIPLKEGLYNFNLSIEKPIVLNVKHEFLDVIEGCMPIKIGWGEIKFPMVFHMDYMEVQVRKFI